MKIHTVGIIMNGVTGRMGTNQHLVRSILAIRQQGGVKIGSGRGRSCPTRSSSAATPTSWQPWPQEHGVERFTTDLDARAGRPATRSTSTP